MVHRIVMNPPFRNDADVAHVKHALRFPARQSKTSTTAPLKPACVEPRRRRLRRDSNLAKSVAVIARIIGPGYACIPSRTGVWVLLHHSRNLPRLKGHAACSGKTVTLSRPNLRLDAAAAVLVTLVSLKKGGKR